jgi:methionyl-tRNA formyltransferase
MKDKTIVMLAARGKSTSIVYNALKDDFQIEKVVIEEPVPRSQLLQRRAKKLGYSKVFGQILFQLAIVPYLNFAAKQRVKEIKESFNLNDAPIDESKVVNVDSINSEETIRILKEINPDLVIINGTRIISKDVINCIPTKFFNMHAGITPLYRGVHGGYWSLVERNEKACGVTVHLVDTGIDTGNIIEQGIIQPTEQDSFVTYPLLQLATGIPLLKKAIQDIFENKLEVKAAPEGKSQLWSHPTAFEYIWYKIRYGVK